MLYKNLLEIVINLEFDSKKVIYSYDNYKIYIYRPSVLSKRFKNYDVQKNFQIWLSDGTREFRPNHLRVLIDLNLRTRCRPELKENLLLAFDNIFYGKDPVDELKELDAEYFEHRLNPIAITGVLAQLFFIEQEYGYVSNRESNYDPPTLFFQGWIREFIDNPKEIDNLCMSVCKFQPPSSKYTIAENKKSTKYRSGLDELWYLK